MATKCEAKMVGSWTGNTYYCELYGNTHEYHSNIKEGFVWFNFETYCGQQFGTTKEHCHRKPKHSGLCRVTVNGVKYRFERYK